MVPSRTCRPSPVISRAMARGCQTRRVGGRVGQPGQAAELLVADGLPGRHRPQSRPGGLLGGVAGLGHGDVGERPGLALQIGEHPGGHGAGVGGRPENPAAQTPSSPTSRVNGPIGVGTVVVCSCMVVASAGWAVPHLWNTARVGLVAAPEAKTGRLRDRLGWPYRPTERFDNVTATEVPAKAGRREWIGLAVLALACLLYVMDLTVLHLAVPALSADLAPTSAQLLWIIDIYGFFVAGSLITMGTLGDRIGRRKLLLIGATSFGLVSLGAAFSPTAESLIVSRALLGIAGATLAPSTLSLIFHMFQDPRERSIAIGFWIGSFSAGSAIGPVLGGAMLELFWWGSVFLLALPVLAAMSVLAVLGVIYGLKEIAQDGLSGASVAAIVAGLAIGVAFVARQRRLAEPVI